MLAAVVAALALQAAEPPIVIDGRPVGVAEVEAAAPRYEGETVPEWHARNAMALASRAWLDGEAERRGVETGPGARLRLAIEALDRTGDLHGYGRWIAAASARWRARTTCSEELLASGWRTDLLLGMRPQLGDACGNGARELYRCRPIALLRWCRAPGGRWFVAGDAARSIGPRANFGAEVRLRRRLRRDHPALLRRIGWDTDADFVHASTHSRRAAVAVVVATAQLAAGRGLTRTR
jgi:hypothetical protein